MGTKHIFKNKNGTIPSFKFWSCVSRFVGGDAVSSSLSRICEPAPAFCSDFPGISIASSPDGFPRWLSVKEAACQCRRHRRCGFSPWVGKIPWKRKWQPTPVFFPGEFHGQRSLVGYSPWVPKDSDTTEWLTHSFIPSPEISVTTVPVLRLIIQIPFHCIINLLIRLQIFNLCFWIYDLPSLWRYTVAFLEIFYLKPNAGPRR